VKVIDPARADSTESSDASKSHMQPGALGTSLYGRRQMLCGHLIDLDLEGCRGERPEIGFNICFHRVLNRTDRKRCLRFSASDWHTPRASLPSLGRPAEPASASRAHNIISAGREV